MFGKKNYTIEPIAANEDVLIQISEPTEITKKTKVSVPTQYKAIAFIDQKPLFRIEPCINKEFVKTYGKEYIGKQLRIAFVANRTLAQSAWGFGNIQVNNEGLKEAYRIGANGKFSIEIVDYAKMRKAKIPFWDAFMGKPLCVAVYHIATKDEGITPEALVSLKMMPAIMIMDNAFYYGECEIIGNMPITFEEENCPIHYGESFDAHKRDHICFQHGKTFVTLENEKLLYDYDFKNMAIGWDLEVELPILSECIRKNSNEPYWDMIHPYQANRDLRNPKFKKELKAIKAQMGIK